MKEKRKTELLEKCVEWISEHIADAEDRFEALAGRVGFTSEELHEFGVDDLDKFMEEGVDYLEQSKRTAEEELEKALETLYQKTVPAGVREFLDMKSGTGNAQPAKTKKAKPIPLSAVGAKDAETSMGKV